MAQKRNDTTTKGKTNKQNLELRKERVNKVITYILKRSHWKQQKGAKTDENTAGAMEG